ncbi:response regulator transcription factor [Gorillibacterium sp. sgz5001074]|uniref:response regulator transcription factor n=1 Tax=Gorillibacterium sp. sgz5001074 TaxID=3446695 RepID=UPI003F67BAB3
MIGKLLIVDDESWCREGLMKLIGSEHLGWEVVGEASDGEEALALIETAKPDLIITDIRMPVVDGLMLTERLAQAGSEIMVILLTGYRDFEYAQRALRYGAIEFLLKPMSIQDTTRILRTAYERFRQKQLDQKLRQREKQVNTLRAALYRLPCDRQDWAEMSGLLSGYELWLLQVDSFFPEGRGYGEKDVKLLHYAISNIAGELLQVQDRALNSVYLSVSSGEFVFLLAPGVVEPYCSLVAENVESLLHLKTKWSLAGTMNELDSLAAGYAELRGASHAHNQPMDSEADRSLALRESILSDLIIGDVEEARRKLARHIQRAAALPIQTCKIEIYAMVSALSDLLAGDFKHLRADDYDDLQPGALLLFSENRQIIEWAEHKAETFLRLFEGWLQEKRDNVVIRAQQYIETHYRENCSLQAVSAHVHVTPNYLSNLFKRETGIAFSNYVSKLRVEKAKALLTCTKMRMTEIADQVGFDNASYFTTVFKQLAGISPSEYRKSQ